MGSAVQLIHALDLTQLRASHSTPRSSPVTHQHYIQSKNKLSRHIGGTNGLYWWRFYLHVSMVCEFWIATSVPNVAQLWAVDFYNIWYMANGCHSGLGLKLDQQKWELIPEVTCLVKIFRSTYMYSQNKLLQESFASLGKKCFTSKMEDTKIIMYVWSYAFEIELALIWYLICEKRMNNKVLDIWLILGHIRKFRILYTSLLVLPMSPWAFQHTDGL